MLEGERNHLRVYTRENMSQSKPGISRRRFGQRAALLGGLLPTASQAQRQQGPPMSDAENGEVEARYQEAMRRYGSRMNDEQKQRIRTILSTNERMMRSIREFPLDNGDAPATTLKLAGGETAYRAKTAPAAAKGK
jgi:hypothetical protein